MMAALPLLSGAGIGIIGLIIIIIVVILVFRLL
jgi:hypothetical protein